MTPRLGVTVGKFYPPHMGHSHLIAEAKARCDRLVVLVADLPAQSLRASDRARWLADVHPEVEFIVTPDDLPEAPGPWAARALQLLGRVPDVAFTSEEYGDAWATAMGCPHECIDLPRAAWPLSGTEVRADLAGRFTQLVPSARRDLALDVVVAGVESSGTTTLAGALARSLGTVEVPEYGRDYWVEREASRPGEPWTTDDFLHIADEHHRRGDALALDSTGVTVWDTDALCTAVWHRRYLDVDSPELDAITGARKPDLYLLTAPDFPFVQDGTREDGPHRAEMHRWFRSRLDASGVPWIEVRGAHDQRLASALEAVAALPRPILA